MLTSHQGHQSNELEGRKESFAHCFNFRPEFRRVSSVSKIHCPWGKQKCATRGFAGVHGVFPFRTQRKTMSRGISGLDRLLF